MSLKQPHRTPLLPLKDLNWAKIAPYLGNAREAVARLDEEPFRTCFLEPLFWSESIASLRTQGIEERFKEVLLYAFANLGKKENEPFLQKVVYVKMALDLAADKKIDQRLGQRFFCQLHALIKKDCIHPNDIGQIRKRQNWIGFPGCKIEEASFLPPEPSKIKPLLRNFDAYLKAKEKDPLVQNAIAFAQFLIIHPFMDGNGRAARMFIPLFAMQKRLLSHPILLLSRFFEEHRKDYFQKLFHLTTDDAWEEWVIYFLKGVSLEAKRTKQQLIRLNSLFEETESLVGKSLQKNFLKNLFYMTTKAARLLFLLKGKSSSRRRNKFIFSIL